MSPRHDDPAAGPCRPAHHHCTARPQPASDDLLGMAWRRARRRINPLTTVRPEAGRHASADWLPARHARLRQSDADMGRHSENGPAPRLLTVPRSWVPTAQNLHAPGSRQPGRTYAPWPRPSPTGSRQPARTYAPMAQTIRSAQAPRPATEAFRGLSVIEASMSETSTARPPPPRGPPRTPQVIRPVETPGRHAWLRWVRPRGWRGGPSWRRPRPGRPAAGAPSR